MHILRIWKRISATHKFLPDRYEFLVGDREDISVRHGHNTVPVITTFDIGHMGFVDEIASVNPYKICRQLTACVCQCLNGFNDDILVVQQKMVSHGFQIQDFPFVDIINGLIDRFDLKAFFKVFFLRNCNKGNLPGNQNNGIIPMYRPELSMRKIFRLVIAGKKYGI
jgi:hypothetical protein